MASRETPASLRASFSDPSCIRNLCILAHVDHGKTTLTDCLLSANHIVSAKQAGTVRYMDSTEEEQARGITMKSSAIALVHCDEPYRELRAASPPSGGAAAQVRYLINLIDSPGHVDFSMDVVTAARLCDGAIVVVDAVEGVCIQTHAVLRSAWQEGVRPLLLINKLDRLICELQLTPLEAYAHINRIIEGVNVIMSSLFRAEAMGAAAAATAATTTAPSPAAAPEEPQEEKEMPSDGSPLTISTDTWAFELDEAAERQLFFDPAKGNVVFASAYDGWAFTVDDFARQHSARLGVPIPLLRRALWGPWYYKAKAKKIVTGAAPAEAAKGRCMAVTMMLDNIWAVYSALLLAPSEERAGKIFAALGLTERMPARELAASRDAKARLQAVMRCWLPLHAAVLSTVCRVLPSPREAQGKRVDRLWPLVAGGMEAAAAAAAAAAAVAGSGEVGGLTEQCTLAQRLARVRAGIAACSTAADAECVVFVSKMFAVPTAALPPIPSEEGGGAAASMAAMPPASSLWGLQADTSASAEGPPLTLQEQFLSPALWESCCSPTPSSAASGSSSSSSSSESAGGGGGLQESFVAFARVFSGVLRPHSPVFVLGPKFSPHHLGSASKHFSAGRVSGCYLMMGRELLPLLEASAGQVVGLGGLGGRVLKSATLCTTPACASLSSMTFQTTPLVRVALSPVRTADLAALEAGLALLDAADPCVEVTVTEAGELQLASLGELHLQRCITDLETRFARCAIRVSPPILEFQETLIAGAGACSMAQPVVAVVGGAGGEGGTGEGSHEAGAAALQGEGGGSSAGVPSLGAASASEGPPGEATPTSTGASSSGLFSSTVLSSIDGSSSGSTPFPVSWAPALLTTTAAYLHVPSGTVYLTTSDKAVTLRLRVLPLPPALTELLCRRECAGLLKELTSDRSTSGSEPNQQQLQQPHSEALVGFIAAMEGILKAAGAPWCDLASGASVCALGPKKVGPNVLFTSPGVFSTLPPPLWGDAAAAAAAAAAAVAASADAAACAAASTLLSLRSALTYGFSLAMASGPLAGEPLRGVGVVLEEVTLRAPTASTGLLIQGMREAVGVGLYAGALRLVEAMYVCELRCSGGIGGGGEALGKCYGVLSKRRGKVLSEELMEGTDTWLITAHLPVVEIYGFADELRKRTSGAATSPQLVFSHWEVMEADPFFMPTSEAEREEMGDTVHKGQGRNLARSFIDSVRERKGLPVTKKLVHDAEKQRNRKK